MTVAELENLARQDHPDPEHLAVIGVAGPLYTTVPSGVTHGGWVAALEHALYAQFAEQ